MKIALFYLPLQKDCCICLVNPEFIHKTCTRDDKKALESPVKGSIWICAPHFSKFRLFRMLHPEQHVFLEFHVDSKTLYFSKSALHVDITHNKWLK